MLTYKLEKNITLFKNQFEKYILEIYNDYRLDRLSLDIDGLLFRIKYMIKHDKDLDKIPELKQEFTNKAIELRDVFGKFLSSFLFNIIGVPDLPTEKIGTEKSIFEDVLAQDVKIDNVYVKFKMVLISSYKEYLKYVDNMITEDKPYNMFPNEYFRFYTDSYNDGISKAYPELFENREQKEVGVGKDADVFCHNFTFQTSEACSLSCTYCLAAETKILMADYTYKDIEDIVVGDIVIGCKENLIDNEKNSFFPTKVTKLFHHKDYCYEISFDNDLTYNRTMRITKDHPIMNNKGEWIKASYIKSKSCIIQGADLLIIDDDSIWNKLRMIIPVKIFPKDYEIDYCSNVKEDVYNFETESHTYIANNIVVHNCYQFNKTPMRMEFETAKKFIDHLLNDDYGYINRYNSPAIIIEFIGGEPLLEIHLTRKIYEYFLDRCYELNHPWFKLHRLSICSNGLQYFDKEVQSFFKEYAHNISFNISIDGNKELHDSCRIQPNGEGSYDIDMMALNHFNRNYTPERNSKMTLAPSNIKFLYDSVVDFIKNGMTCINLNCVFEEGWDQKTANIEYCQLKKLADYLIDNNLDHIYLSIFNERQEDMSPKEQDGNSCGGAGSMLALRPNGQFYPCIRYMPTSVGNNVKDLCIGDVDNGFIGREQESEILKMLDNITRRSQTNDICYECPISNDCMSCTALGHTVFGTPNKRTTFICIQMIAEALANVYYWNRLLLKHPEYDLHVRKNVLPDEWSLLVIDEDELEDLKLLEVMAMISKIENS